MIVVLNPVHLGSLEEIKAAFGVGRGKVWEWINDGAPIAVEYNEKGAVRGISAEYNALQAWRVERSQSAA